MQAIRPNTTTRTSKKPEGLSAKVSSSEDEGEKEEDEEEEEEEEEGVVSCRYYLKLELAGSKARTATQQERGGEVSWSEEFQFHLPGGTSKFALQGRLVRVKEYGSRSYPVEALLGSCSLPLPPLAHGQPQLVWTWAQLEAAGAEKRRELHVAVEVTASRLFRWQPHGGRGRGKEVEEKPREERKSRSGWAAINEEAGRLQRAWRCFLARKTLRKQKETERRRGRSRETGETISDALNQLKKRQAGGRSTLGGGARAKQAQEAMLKYTMSDDFQQRGRRGERGAGERGAGRGWMELRESSPWPVLQAPLRMFSGRPASASMRQWDEQRVDPLWPREEERGRSLNADRWGGGQEVRPAAWLTSKSPGWMGGGSRSMQEEQKGRRDEKLGRFFDFGGAHWGDVHRSAALLLH